VIDKENVSLSTAPPSAVRKGATLENVDPPSSVDRKHGQPLTGRYGRHLREIVEK